MLYPHFMFRGAAAGYTNLGLVVDYAPDLPFSGLAANKTWAAGNRAALQAVLDGYTKGIAWLQDPAHRDEAISMMVELTHSDRSDLTQTFDFLEKIHYFAPDNGVSRRKLNAIVAVLKANGDVPASFDIGKLVLPGATQLTE
jgi:ABC-type nitrate/sulfonate/bicarbonate transport system substrate-binding protein